MYGGGYQYPSGYGPPPASFAPPGGSPYAASPAPGYPAPGASPPGPAYGGGSPAMGGYQQPPPGTGYPPYGPPGGPMPMGGPPPQFAPGPGGPPRHAGLGAPGQAPNLPPPPNLGPPPGMGRMSPSQIPQRPVPTGEIYSLFVGGIAEGVEDAWLERVLGCAGPLMTLRRIKDANGRPKAFGFAEYGDPESVLRCIEVLNGANLPVNGGKGGEKPLKINADEKTRAKLDDYEKTRIKTDQDTDLDNQARERLGAIVSQMRDPSVLAASQSSATDDSLDRRHHHLQDLAPEDLPEESRGLITREIQFFRERAIKRASEKREQREEKISSGYYNQGASQAVPSGGAGPSRQNGPAGGPQSDRGWGSGPRGYGNHQAQGSPHGRSGSFNQGGPPGHQDPQSFNRPVDFVRAAQQAAAQAPITGQDGAPLTDAEEEQHRAERRRQANLSEYRDRERRWLGRERTRGQALAREAHRDRTAQLAEGDRRSSMRERLALWDDEVELEKGRELFLTDRARWRAQRRQIREREAADDRMDVEQERRQIEAAKRESEAFLSQQADLFANSGDDAAQRGGLLQLDDGVPIKLSFGGTKVAVSTNATTVKKEAGGVLLAADDDEVFKRKRELIPLTYDDIDEEKGMTEEEKLERRQKKVREIVASIPSEKAALFEKDLRWEKLNDTIVEEKLRPFANKKIVEYLGLQDDELVGAVVGHVGRHKGAQALVDELEPVLAEEAEEFVIKFWRMLIFELLAVEAGLDTTS